MSRVQESYESYFTFLTVDITLTSSMDEDDDDENDELGDRRAPRIGVGDLLKMNSNNKES